jgi:cytochrome c oxidase subunit 1
MMLASLITGGVDTGWVFYPTFSPAADSSVLLAGLGIILAGISLILLAVNFVVTLHKMRAPGMYWFRLPLFAWSIYLTSILTLIATPMLIATTALVLIEDLFHMGIFSPIYGGNPVLFQYLFWFFGHQLMYLILLPTLGLLFELFAAFTRHTIYGYRAVVYSMIGLTLLGFISWTIHLAGEASLFIALLASLFSLLVIVPISTILLSLIGTLFRGSISFESPMLFAVGAVALFLIGILSGMFLSTLSLSKHLSGTYFVTAHLHYAATAAVMVILGGLHYWWPKATGKMYPEGPARVSALIFFVATQLALLPEFMLGYLGMARHQATYAPEFTVLQISATLGVSILVVGYILPLLYLTWSIFFGPSAAANPWQARGVEWEFAASPPSADNFSETPIITAPAYHYPRPTRPATPPGPKPIATPLR